MPKYRVRQGKKFGPGGRYTAGMILEMSEREATPFLDILEPAADSALVGSKQAVVPHEGLQFQNELGVEVPDDLKIIPGEFNTPDEDLEEEEDESPKPKAKTKSRSTRKGANEE